MKLLSQYFVVITFASLLFLFFGTGAYGAPSNNVSRLKIAYVDFNKALNNVCDGKAAKKRLKEEFAEKQTKLDIMQKNVADAKISLDRSRSLLSKDILLKRERSYRKKFMELQQELSVFNEEMRNRENYLTKAILSRLKKLVADIGRRKGYSIILEKSQSVVLYAPTTDDITNEVVKEYNSWRDNRR